MIEKNKLVLVLIIAVFVVLGGGFLYLRELQRLKNITSPSPAPALTQPQTKETVDTSTWKTYRNEKYGFEFKYPSEIGRGKYNKIFVLEQSVFEPWSFTSYFCSELSCFMNQDFLFIKKYTEENLMKFEKSISARVGDELLFSKKESSVDGVKAVEFLPLNQSSRTRILQITNSGYLFVIKTGQWPPELFEAIRSTFKFIPSTSSGQAN